jgi:hypothetical protein
MIPRESLTFGNHCLKNMLITTEGFFFDSGTISVGTDGLPL